MQPISFPEQNTIIAEHQKEYLPLPAYVTDSAYGEIICKISVSPEELKVIQENGSFYLTMQVGRNPDGQIKPVTPILCFVESPFVQLIELKDLSPLNLHHVFKTGLRIGNLKIGRDIILYEIVNIDGENIAYKLFRPDTKQLIATHIKSFTEFSATLKSVKVCEDKWFIVNPASNNNSNE